MAVIVIVMVILGVVALGGLALLRRRPRTPAEQPKTTSTRVQPPAHPDRQDAPPGSEPSRRR